MVKGKLFILSTALMVGLLSGCSATPASTPTALFKMPSLFSSKAKVQLSIINAESRATVFVNGKNIGKTNYGGNLTTTIKVKPNSEVDIEFRVMRRQGFHIFKQEKLVKAIVKIKSKGKILCDGHVETCELVG